MRPIALTIAVAALALPVVRSEDPKHADAFPRRALFIQVNRGLYLNPLTCGSPQRNREAIERFAASLRIPTAKANNQLFILSDDLPPAEERIPTKPAILAAVRQFCDSSRTQDRILLYFRGHAFEKNDKAYFAPVEGEAGDLRTLIPVAEIYDALKGCKAAQKVVVWDVCPRNPERAAIRPSSGPLTLELLLGLALAPGGVQVVIPCLPAEFSLEYSAAKGDAGTVLLNALREAFEENASRKKPNPDDAIPIVEAFPAVEKYLEAAAKAAAAKQTPKLVGKPLATLPAAEPKEPFAAPVQLPIAKSDSAAEVKSILQELALPPLAIGEVLDPLPILPFDSSTLKPYVADASIDEIFRDAEKYVLRVVVLRALQAVRETMRPTGPQGLKLIATIRSPLTEQTKRGVLDAQAPMALAITKLEGELAVLESAEKLRAKETKRWQANYDYTLSEVRLRLALLNEYNLALGHVRTEALPELQKGFTVWRLTHTEKMLSKKNVQELAEAAKTGLEALAASNKGTPWEVLAKRAALTPPGLRWEPAAK